MLIIPESDLRGLIPYEDAVRAIEQAFAQLARGDVIQPEPMNLELPQLAAEIHVKGAFPLGTDSIVLKLASGFWRNPERGLPTGSGLMLVLDSATGFPVAILLDNGYLTDLRTGAAGGVAARWLTRDRPQRVFLVGAGVQARCQLQGLAAVRTIESIAIWSATPTSAQRLVDELLQTTQWPARAVKNVAEGMSDATIVITVTPSHEPLVRAEWLRPGMHISAVGSDSTDKQELAVDVLARADVLIADRVSQCARLGEIHHALEAGVIRTEDIDAELGDVVLGRHPGRSSDDEITICDLTGVGAQDAAIATLALERYRARQRAG